MKRFCWLMICAVGFPCCIPRWSKNGRKGTGNDSKSSMRTIDDEFYTHGASFEIRHGLGTPDERAVVAGIIMDFLQRRGFNNRWRGNEPLT